MRTAYQITWKGKDREKAKPNSGPGKKGKREERKEEDLEIKKGNRHA